LVLAIEISEGLIVEHQSDIKLAEFLRINMNILKTLLKEEKVKNKEDGKKKTIERKFKCI